MNKLLHSLPAKMAAIFLFIVCLAAFLGGSVGIVYMAQEGYYSPNTFTFYNSGLCADVTHRYTATVYHEYLPLVLEESGADSARLRHLSEQFSKENTNFFFTVTDGDGRVVLSNYTEQEYGYAGSLIFEPDWSSQGFVIEAYVRAPLTAQDDYMGPYRVFSALYGARYAVIAVVALSAAALIVLFVFLMCAAGRKRGTEGVTLGVIDRIPLDLYAALYIVAWLIAYAFVTNWYGLDILRIIATTLTAAAIVLLTLALCMSFAARVKVGRWWENTVAFRILRLIWRILGKIARAIGRLYRNRSLLWKTIIAFAVFLFFNGILVLMLMASYGLVTAVVVLLGLVFNGGVLIGLCLLVIQLNTVRRSGKLLAAGDYSKKIDTGRMFWEIRGHAEDLNNIGLGMSRAVEERMRGERLKTELITNVSHDIKTPLTSIVNYVDLLKKEEVDGETAREYIEVLDRQSARLKKLTEDLFEASKAATGNLAVTLTPTDVVELLNQSVAEYDDRFTARRLEAVVAVPAGGGIVLADGRLLWRVFDNLLGNVCKYAQPGTRVYLEVAADSGTVAATIKNISEHPLNITPEELMERFVRGDSARATDGSGLGLSIARSLTELQSGRFELAVDGDLFKATVSFKAFADGGEVPVAG